MASDKNTCDCPHPPGGRVACEDDQLAICRIRNGVVDAQCLDVPASVKRTGRKAIRRWCVEQIIGDDPTVGLAVSPRERVDLQRGVYQVEGSEARVTFRLPKSARD